MIDTANTLVKAANKALEEGALSVTVFATHGVLSYNSDFDNACHRLRKSKIKHVYISNTMNNCQVGYEHDPLAQSDKIHMLDVTITFAQAIEKIIAESPYAELPKYGH
jgi:phosphoribosylpyrophosphate synthetase